ncbi:TetR/AcrR family transcriptional regulator [Streptomyces omiyaensis]|uniref:TetR/AcrR family transcriptional regulator n=1 Tax=Streptomyces omiyaensis TaxID=68247 RepID=A0ABW7C4E4_9ACTN|nr:TetR/AcrR family transcriptional regulator [Streptomyces omiyaensis]GGY78221.1 TetR family transcriptional regulator [Streptomyces omiyaensis]
MSGDKDAKAAPGDGGTFLPPSIEAAWGLRERPTKGPRPGLSLDRIVAAAVALASAEGLAAVSMGRVAKELGVSTMSLYRYVSAKSELYVLMQEAATGGPPEGLVDPEAGWRTGLERVALALREIYRRSPWLLRVPVSGPPATPNGVAWWEQMLLAMAGTGLDEGEKLAVTLLVSGFVKNDALVMVELAEAVEASGAAPQEAMLQYSRTLRRLVDPAVFPQVAKVIDSGILDRADDPDDDFRFGLARILDGVAALVEGRAS